MALWNKNTFVIFVKITRHNSLNYFSKAFSNLLNVMLKKKNITKLFLLKIVPILNSLFIFIDTLIKDNVQ